LLQRGTGGGERNKKRREEKKKGGEGRKTFVFPLGQKKATITRLGSHRTLNELSHAFIHTYTHAPSTSTSTYPIAKTNIKKPTSMNNDWYPTKLAVDCLAHLFPTNCTPHSLLCSPLATTLGVLAAPRKLLSTWCLVLGFIASSSFLFFPVCVQREGNKRRQRSQQPRRRCLNLAFEGLFPFLAPHHTDSPSGDK
jgi:hypothetical protein